MAGKKILLVEGSDDEHVLKHICGERGVGKLDEVKPQGDVLRLLENFPVRLKESDVEALGVVIDTDTELAARWQSLRDRLTKAGYQNVPANPAPAGTILAPPSEGLLPRVGVWIMPDNQTRGILEDFLHFLVPSGSKLFGHVKSSVPPLCGRQSGATARAVSGRGQRASARELVPHHRSVRSPARAHLTPGPLSGGPASARTRRWLRRAGASGPHGTASAPPMGRLLAGRPTLRTTRAGSVLGPAPARQSGGHLLAAHSANAGQLPAPGSGQRMALAPALVRAERDGRFARGRCRAGGEEWALSHTGQSARAQAGALCAFAGALAGFVRRPVRCAALRFDFDLLRERAAGG